MWWRSPIMSSSISREELGDYSLWLAVLTVAGEQQKFQTAGVRTGKRIQSRSNTDSHITLERCEMQARYAVVEKCELVYK
jgi:hypothetical protein